MSSMQMFYLNLNQNKLSDNQKPAAYAIPLDELRKPAVITTKVYKQSLARLAQATPEEVTRHATLFAWRPW